MTGLAEIERRGGKRTKRFLQEWLDQIVIGGPASAPQNPMHGTSSNVLRSGATLRPTHPRLNWETNGPRGRKPCPAIGPPEAALKLAGPIC